MSLRSAFKAKFKSFEQRDGTGDGPKRDPLTKATSLPNDESDLYQSTEFKDCVESREDSKHGPSIISFGSGGGGAGSPGSSPPTSPRQTHNVSLDGEGFKDREEKAVYEGQLTQLQEQLVAAMIENQNLAGELKEIKDKSQLDKLHRQLEFEKERNQILTNRLKEKTKESRQASFKKHRSIGKGSSSSTDGIDVAGIGDDWVDMAQEISEDTVLTPDVAAPPPPKPSLTRRLHEWLYSFFYELIADFSEEVETEQQQEGEDVPLTVKQLKENIKRFYAATKPIVNTTKGVKAMLSWKTPSLSLLVLSLYMYAVWYDWLLPLIMFLAVFRLSVNFLRHRGWNVDVHYLQYQEDKEEVEEKDTTGVGDKFNLVLQVAKSVQNGLGQIADSLEKMKNLMTWKQPTATAKMYFSMCFMFILSCFLPGYVCFTVTALYMGVKLFLIDYIFNRFPRVRAKHDTAYQVWQQLPTDAELERRTTRAEIDRYILPPTPLDMTEDEGDFLSRPLLSAEDRYFLELFSLPQTECPLPAWSGGRRCTLINREKSLTSAFKNGKLYLTRSFLCFERSKTQTPKNLVIPLTDIIKIEKAKPYSWMPGGGMALEIHVGGIDKPYTFGALLNRDEAYETIIIAGRRANLEWSFGQPAVEAPPVGASAN
ncbi:GRAM domain-containing protein 4-like isoform X2 [Lineus longissimus]|uniref:GRAM domain-containing protein 4-like isoform X2 n=1 Tax=Lineus longissimus TaxID=88925 RepID=UPI002B4CD391